ncbi:hypothetical protein, partial [Burkholderia mallei]|uniref:hypothetical protein n=1 Tax=Burkholderia mallei TaxID=13373 RepID=UPI00006DD1FF
DGWWMYEDADLRIPGSPGIDSSTWRRVLAEEGFERFASPQHPAEMLTMSSTPIASTFVQPRVGGDLA